MADGLTLVSLITASSRELGATAHSRAWRVPAASAEAFAEAMTERYGEPVEGLSTVGAMQRRAESNAADGFLFTDPEVPDA
jgi:hypothetical protein